MKLDSRERGISLVDSLIAILVLSIGLVLYSKNWTANYSAKNSTYARSIAATQVAEIGNVLLANISDLDRDEPRGQLISRVQRFSNDLASHINSFAASGGYECKEGEPRAITTGRGAIGNLSESTLPRTWAQGAASCITITPMPAQTTQTNGVWVLIKASWIDAHTRDEQTESVSLYTLVSPL